MFGRNRAVLDVREAEPAVAHADAVARAVRASAEITRLSALVRSTTIVVTAAEAHAVEAVTAADSSSTSDGDIMLAVTSARARRDAAVIALERAHNEDREAKSALPTIERMLRRSEAESELASLQPLVDDVHRALETLANAVPLLEQRYDKGMQQLLNSIDPSVTGIHRPTVMPLQLGARIQSVLYRDIGYNVFRDIVPGVTSLKLVAEHSTLTENINELIANLQSRIAESEAALT